MLRNFLEHELIFKEYPNKVSSSESNRDGQLNVSRQRVNDLEAEIQSLTE
jgi:hypothetical protein